MHDDHSLGGRDLIRERESVVTIIRGLTIGVGMALTFWAVVGFVTWRVAHAIVSALS